jgi:hypothetical protein
MAWMINSCHLSVMLHHSYTIYFAYATNLEDNEQFLWVPFLCLLCLDFLGYGWGLFLWFLPASDGWQPAIHPLMKTELIVYVLLCTCRVTTICMSRQAGSCIELLHFHLYGLFFTLLVIAILILISCYSSFFLNRMHNFSLEILVYRELLY